MPAVKHALAAEEFALAAHMIEIQAQQLSISHEWRTLADMLQTVPVAAGGQPLVTHV